MPQSHLRKANAILFFGFALLLLFYYGAPFLIPLTFGAFLAALVEPIATFLEEKAPLGRIIPSLISTLIVFVVVGGIAYLLIYQLTIFANDLPHIREEFKSFFHDLQHKFSEASGIPMRVQKEFIQDRSEMILSTVESELTNFLGNLLNVTLKFLLVLIYVFLFLLYRKKIKLFVFMYTNSENKDNMQEIISRGSKLIYAYLWGRFKVMTLLAIMYIIAFWLFDIPYALLLTIFGAIITIIPYVGPFISGLLPIVFVIVFGRDFSEILIFGSVVLIIQLIESYVLEPVIIGSEVELSPLAVIVAILIGGMLWGMAGMILFVPIFAIGKVIAEHTPSLRPIGFLLDDKKSPQE